MADHCADLGERLVIERRVELTRMDIGPEGTARLNGPNRPPGGRPAAEILEKYPDSPEAGPAKSLQEVL